MKAEKLMKLLAVCSCCVLLGGCAGVNARVQETETILEETELPVSEETQADEEVSVETIAEEVLEEAQVLDQSAEDKVVTQALVEEEREAEPETDTEIETESEQETENVREENQQRLEYNVEDQELEIGKCFGDIAVPEYALTEDGSKVSGKVEWRKPGKNRVFDQDMALTGMEGEKRTWEWTFVPDDTGYETVTGTAELTMREPQAEEEGTLAGLVNLWTDKVTDETSGSSSASGSSIGASNIIEVSDLREIGKWMGSMITGAGILGEETGGVKTAGKENFAVAHGTVKREEAEIQKSPETEKENDTVDTGKAVSGKEAEPTKARIKAAGTNHKEKRMLPEQKTDTMEMSCQEALEYGKAGATIFLLSQSWYLR